MDTQILKYIYDITVYGSITRAAQVNFISPSHLSRQVKKIEETFSISIFERNSNGVFLTKQGQEFIQYVEPILKNTMLLEKRYNCQPRSQELFSFRIAIHHNSMGNQAALDLIRDHINSYEYADIVVDTYNSLEETVYAVRKYRYLLGVIQFGSANQKKVNAFLCAENLKKIDIDISPLSVLVAQTHPLAVFQSVTPDVLDEYPRIFYMDEELSNQQDMTGMNIPNSQTVKKRILIKERAQLFHYLQELNAYYIGPRLSPGCCVCEGITMVQLKAPEKYTVYTSVIYSSNAPNNVLLNQYLKSIRFVAQDLSGEKCVK